MLARFGRLLLRLILEFAVVEDLADGRVGFRRNLHKVEPGLDGPLEGISVRHDANVISRLVNQSYFAGPDRVVDPGAGWLALGRGSHWSADVVSPRMASLVSRFLH